MTKKADLPGVPAALADVALVDGPTCAAAAGISLSTWHEAVRTQRAPSPVVRGHRCTRWRLADVRAWLQARAEGEPSTGASVIAVATRASAAAKVKRLAAKAASSASVQVAAAEPREAANASHVASVSPAADHSPATPASSASWASRRAKVVLKQDR